MLLFQNYLAAELKLVVEGSNNNLSSTFCLLSSAGTEGIPTINNSARKRF